MCSFLRIKKDNAKRVPDEVVYHYYKPNKRGEWDHKIIKDVEPFEKQGKVFVKKHHDSKNHHHFLEDENVYERYGNRRDRNFDRDDDYGRRGDYSVYERSRNRYMDDEYVYYNGIKTVYNHNHSRRKPVNIYIKNYY